MTRRTCRRPRAIRADYAGRRIVAVFEPRSNSSRRAVFQQDYARALRAADLVVLSAVYRKENDAVAESEMLSTDRLVADLGSAGAAAWSAAGPDEILERLVPQLRSGDVVLCMSNGAFGNLPRRIVAALS
ncbi:MAG: hypothetical protein HY899_12110 [Deltaproteobacteria bacterium]|nr:hypothetical protein [Deltaproteobacteria bacterium]